MSFNYKLGQIQEHTQELNKTDSPRDSLRTCVIYFGTLMDF